MAAGIARVIKMADVGALIDAANPIPAPYEATDDKRDAAKISL
jgi:hypothetical protein